MYEGKSQILLIVAIKIIAKMEIEYFFVAIKLLTKKSWELEVNFCLLRALLGVNQRLHDAWG